MIQKNEPEVARVRAVPRIRATQFDVSMGCVTYRVAIGWVEFDHTRYPDLMLHTRLDFAKEHLKHAVYLENKTASRSGT